MRLAYAPNVGRPLDVDYQMTGLGDRQAADFFDHDRMAARYPGSLLSAEMGRGTHFFSDQLFWNTTGAQPGSMVLEVMRQHISGKRSRPSRTSAASALSVKLP